MGWFRQLLSRRRVYDDLSAEIREHLKEKIEELVAGGMSRKDASVAARREFGNLTLVEEDSRAVWGWTAIESSLADIRYGLRTMRRNPGFTALAILSLALGIGANTAIFSLINTLMLRTLPVRDPGQLVALLHQYIISARKPVLKTMAVKKVTTMAAQVDETIVPERLIALLSGWFGGLGALLAAIGLNGLLAYTVARRINEIGIRMALGATSGKVTRMVLREALVMACAALIIGIPLTF